jgi:hypothetical protein
MRRRIGGSNGLAETTLMSGSTENRTSGAFEQSRGLSATFTWPAAQRMLPLVRRIVADVLQHQRLLARMHAEKGRLDRNRRSLAWPARSRRYQLQEEIAGTEQDLKSTLGELEALGVVLVDRGAGQVGFPTFVNDRPACFSWRPGEEGLLYWHFADDPTRREIPVSWTKPETRRRGASRSEPRP